MEALCLSVRMQVYVLNLRIYFYKMIMSETQCSVHDYNCQKLYDIK